MLRFGSTVRQRLISAARTSETAHLVVGAGLLLIIGQLAFRAWALYPSFFFLDDYNLLIDAQGQRLDLSYLLSPYNSHLMPGGRLIAWVVASSGELNWTLAATITLVLQALAGVCGLWMLTTLFGVRWEILAPFALYLSTAITIPAAMWWAAALNQLPLQVALFMAVGSWVRHLRHEGRRWAFISFFALAFGLAFYVKAVLLFPLLAFLTLAYFATGSLRHRLVTVVNRHWGGAAVGSALLAGYLAYYLTHVEQLYSDVKPGILAEIADTMLGTAFVTGVIGGPWNWADLAPPTAYANPPMWSVHLAWIAVTLTIAYGFLRRNGTLRSWVLLGGYLIGLLVLLGTSRAPSFGRVIGLEYRYLTDAAGVLALCLGLAFLPLVGARDPSSPRKHPLLILRVRESMVVGIVILVSASSVVSSSLYVGFWHHDNASAAYLDNLGADLGTHGGVDLVDQVVPDGVLSNLAAPNNTVSRLTSLLTPAAAFPNSSPNLTVVADDGRLHRALIQPGVLSRVGPRQDCGWPVGQEVADIPLTARAFEWQWWLRIGYLASTDSPIQVTAGSTTVDTQVQAGLNSLYVKVNGTFDSVRIDGLDPGVTLCVDTIEVGQPVAGGRL